jgi:hypothetical protein
VITNERIWNYLSGKTVLGFMLYAVYIFELILTEFCTGKFAFDDTFISIFDKKEQSSPRDTLDNSRLVEDTAYKRVGEEDSLSSKSNLSLASVKVVNSLGSKSSMSKKIARMTKHTQLGMEPVEIRNAECKVRERERFRPNLHRQHRQHESTRLLRKIKVRKLDIKDISTIQLREIPDEIKKWKKVSAEGLEVVQGELHESDSVYLVSELSEGLDSLEELLRKEVRLGGQVKLGIIKRLVKILMPLENLGDGYSHGHLSTANILVGEF